MARPRKAEVIPEKDTDKKNEGLVTLKHFAKSGRVFIGGEIYPIEDGYIHVKPEHVAKAKEHIKLGG
jgi:hypothetical protein